MADIPASTIEPIDPGLGVSEAATMRPVVLGIASAGATDEINWYSSASALVADYVSGPGVEDAAQLLAFAGGPVGFVRVNGSVAGTNSAITKSGGGPTITIAGTAKVDVSYILEIVDGGALGTGTFRYTLDANDEVAESGRTY